MHSVHRKSTPFDTKIAAWIYDPAPTVREGVTFIPIPKVSCSRNPGAHARGSDVKKGALRHPFQITNVACL